MIPWYVRHADKIVGVLVVIALCAVLLVYGRGCAKQEQVRQTAKDQARAIERTEQSVAISADTQKRVDSEGVETRKRTAVAVEKIDAVIQASPVAAGPADADVLRESREAHQRAIAAHCRVQRESHCADPAAAPGQ